MKKTGNNISDQPPSTDEEKEKSHPKPPLKDSEIMEKLIASAKA